MSDHYAPLFVHLVWSTWNRERLLSGSVERAVYAAVVAELQSRQCRLLALGGTDDHVHVLVCLHPSRSVAELVAAAKTVSSRTVHRTVKAAFRWQRGYGAFSVDPRGLPRLVDYIKNQRTLHDDDLANPELEGPEGDFNGPWLQDP